MKKVVLSDLHFLSSALEDLGFIKQAQEVDDIFRKVAKKKAKKKKNVPNNPSLWSECKAWAKRTFDVYPSAYANGAAAKRYKSKGGTWRKSSSENNIRIANLSRPDNNNESLSGSARINNQREEIKNLNNTENNTIPATPVINTKYSGYMEMGYTQIIGILKEMLIQDQIAEADELLKAVVEGSTQLRDDQKGYLQKHYDRIKRSMIENVSKLPPVDKDMSLKAYETAQTIISNIFRRMGVEDVANFSNADKRWELVLKQVNKIKDNKTREFAFNILGQFTQDNWFRAK